MALQKRPSRWPLPLPTDLYSPWPENPIQQHSEQHDNQPRVEARSDLNGVEGADDRHAESSRANQEHACRLEFLLAWATDVPQDEMASVTFDFFR